MTLSAELPQRTGQHMRYGSQTRWPRGFMTDALAIETPGFFASGHLEVGVSNKPASYRPPVDVRDGGSGADDRHIGQIGRPGVR